MIEICAVGGYNEVGKNMTAVKVDDDVIILDMGLHLESYIRYTEDEDIRDVSSKELLNHFSSIPLPRESILKLHSPERSIVGVVCFPVQLKTAVRKINMMRFGVFMKIVFYRELCELKRINIPVLCTSDSFIVICFYKCCGATHLGLFYVSLFSTNIARLCRSGSFLW